MSLWNIIRSQNPLVLDEYNLFNIVGLLCLLYSLLIIKSFWIECYNTRTVSCIMIYK